MFSKGNFFVLHAVHFKAICTHYFFFCRLQGKSSGTDGSRNSPRANVVSNASSNNAKSSGVSSDNDSSTVNEVRTRSSSRMAGVENNEGNSSTKKEKAADTDSDEEDELSNFYWVSTEVIDQVKPDDL